MVIEVLLQHDLPILQEDKGLGIVAVQKGIQTVDLVLAIPQLSRGCSFPGAAGGRREVEGLCTGTEH